MAASGAFLMAVDSLESLCGCVCVRLTQIP